MKKPSGYWTKDRVFEEARKYQTRGEFQKSCRGAWKVAWKNAWLDEMTWFKEVTVWTKDNVFEESKKYQTRTEFYKGSSGAYNFARKNNLFDEMTWLARPNTTNKKWTKERVFEESRKYKSRKWFSVGCGTAYGLACENNWLDEMTWLVRPNATNKKWTKDRVFEEARKYQTRTEFCRTSSGAYDVARGNRWLDEMTWFKEVRKPSGYWTKERVFEEARKYKTRNEFRKGNSRAYQVARKNNWLDEMVWLIDGRLKMFTDKIDCVYRYFFTETNFIYVGRTVDIKKRNNDHRTKKNDIVFRYANENGFEIPQMEIIEDKLTLEEGQEREDYWKEYYVRNGYNVLNKAKTGKGVGSLGAFSHGKWAWSKDRVFEESRKYQSRRGFQKGCGGAYYVARINRWLDEMIWLKERHKPNGYWTKDKVFEESRKYQTRRAFSMGCDVAYIIACKNKWLDEMVWLKVLRKPAGYWTKDRVFEEARKYQTRKIFEKGSSRAYEVARKNGWLDELFPKKKIKMQS